MDIEIEPLHFLHLSCLYRNGKMIFFQSCRILDIIAARILFLWFGNYIEMILEKAVHHFLMIIWHDSVVLAVSKVAIHAFIGFWCIYFVKAFETLEKIASFDLGLQLFRCEFQRPLEFLTKQSCKILRFAAIKLIGTSRWAQEYAFMKFSIETI